MKKKASIIGLIVFIIDILTKYYFESQFVINESKTIIDNFFSFHLVHNTGASWSILSGNTWILIILSFICLIFILKYMNDFKKSFWNTISFGFLLGGLLGNLFDRITKKYVIDFLSFKIFNYNFPVFNVADIFIVCGVIMIIISIIKGEDKNV